MPCLHQIVERPARNSTNRARNFSHCPKVCRDAFLPVANALRSADFQLALNCWETSASGTRRSNPWKAPRATRSSVATPAWTRRRAYSISSSTNRSMAPTPIQAGGRPATLATRAGTAPARTLDEPAGTPSSELQAKQLALAVHIKWPMAGGAGRVLLVRSSNWG